MEYSSFLVRQGGLKDGDDDVSPGTEAYRESLLQALSQGKRRQKGVLSFKTTPAQKGKDSTSFFAYICSSQVMWHVIIPCVFR